MADSPENFRPNPNEKIDDSTTRTLLADTHDQMITVNVPLKNGKMDQRQYEVHLPNGMQSVPADSHLPVVIAFDGTTANKPYTGMAVDNRINAEADRDNFIAIYPLPKPRVVGPGIGDKTMRDWNSPGVGAVDTDPTYDDVDYVKAVIADVNGRFHPQQGFHAADMSLGGEFQRKLDHELPAGTFRDEFVVSSTVFGTEGSPRPGIPVKFVHGDNDPILPTLGGPMHPDVGWAKNKLMRMFEATDRTDQQSPTRMLQDELTANGITSQPLPEDHVTFSETRYQGTNGTLIVSDVVKNAGHFWFGRARGGVHETIATDSNGVNPPAEAYDATHEMAKWFGLAKD